MQGRLRFIDIPAVVEAVIDRHNSVLHPSLETILEVDGWARIAASEAIDARASLA
jgi:1-deoxy-D-xylulose 5-phosphate reductoisomerase